MKKNLFYFLPFLAFFACKKENMTTANGSFEGTWVFNRIEMIDSTNYLYVYSQEGDFKDDLPGYKFKDDGTLIARRNPSFCGTPPITYTNTEGEWSKTTNDTIAIQIKAPSFISAPFSTYKMYVKSVESKELRVHFFY
jgi:hypothetical protein